MKANSPIFKSPGRGFRGAETKSIKNTPPPSERLFSRAGSCTDGMRYTRDTAFAMSIDNQAVRCNHVNVFVFVFLKNLNLYEPLLTPSEGVSGRAFLQNTASRRQNL